jgi:hypothetical protein
MGAKRVLEQALDLVSGDRADAHGPIWENHNNIAMLWNGYLYNKDYLLAADVANMMELLKIARRKLGTFSEDDYVDGAGYAAVALECAENEPHFQEELTKEVWKGWRKEKERQRVAEMFADDEKES